MPNSDVSVKLDPGDLTELKVVLSGIKNGFPAVVTRAINKTLTGVITDADFEIRKYLNLKSARVKQDFYVTKATWGDMRGAVYAHGEPVNYGAFIGVKNLAKYKGLRVKIRPNEQPVDFRHGWLWIRPTKSGDIAQTAFQRKYKGPFTDWRPTPQNIGFLFTLPKEMREVEALDGPRIEDEYAKPRTLGVVQEKADERFQKNLAAELNYELIKYAKKI